MNEGGQCKKCGTEWHISGVTCDCQKSNAGRSGDSAGEVDKIAILCTHTDSLRVIDQSKTDGT